MNAIRVLHVVPSLFEDGRIMGGGERYALELARHMAARTPTRLISFGEEAAPRVDGLPIRMLDGARHVNGNRFNPFTTDVIGEVLQADVVHCHQGGVLVSKLMAAVARSTGRTVVTTDHGGAMWDLSWYLPLERLYQAHLHVSAFSRRNAGHEDRPDAEVIYGGIDVQRFHPAAQAAASGRVLFVGRLLPHKGVDDLIESLPEGLGLDVAGRVADERYLLDLKRLARGKDVLFHHDWNDEELVVGYQRALCVVLPSKHVDRYGVRTEVPELLGQTVLEGMACGRPAVVSGVTSLPEVVLDGVTGFVVREGDHRALREKLVLLAGDPARADLLGEAARARVVTTFSWPAVVQRCLNAYARFRPQ